MDDRNGRSVVSELGDKADTFIVNEGRFLKRSSTRLQFFFHIFRTRFFELS